MKGTIQSFEGPALELPAWYRAQIDGEKYLVYVNWVADNGFLHAGDEVEFEEAKPVYAATGFKFLKSLVKLTKEEAIV